MTLDGVVYHTHPTGALGVELLMSCYPVLDRAPKGRDEGDVVPAMAAPT